MNHVTNSSTFVVVMLLCDRMLVGRKESPAPSTWGPSRSKSEKVSARCQAPKLHGFASNSFDSTLEFVEELFVRLTGCSIDIYTAYSHDWREY